MTRNLIEGFYDPFACKDHAAMADCYRENLPTT